MKSKLLKIIRKNFTIKYYWDDDKKETLLYFQNKKTRFTMYHRGLESFHHFYESLCWQLWETFDYKQMWEKRKNARYQRTLRKQFDLLEKN